LRMAAKTKTKGTNGTDGSAGQQQQQKYVEPNHNIHLARKTSLVKCKVDLYRVPPQYVNFDPKPTYFYVDTLKWSKKFVLKKPYPEGVEVDPTDVEGIFDSGVLTCSLPITRDPNKPEGYDEMIAARQQVMEFRKQGLAVPSDILEQSQIPIPKEKNRLLQMQATKSAINSTTSPSTSAAGGGGRISNAKDKKTLQDKKGVKRLQREGGGEEDDQKPKKIKKEKKKKTFVTDSSGLLAVAEQASTEEEKKIQERMDAEYDKLSLLAKKKIELREKKLQRKALRSKEAERITKRPSEEEEEKPVAKKKSATKVSFAE